MRLFVQEPIKTLSTLMLLTGVPGVRAMYSSAETMSARFIGSASAAGSGITPPMPTAYCGLLPQVTVGSTAAASIEISLS